VKVIRVDESGFVIKQGSEAWKRLRVGLLTGTGICDVLPGAKGYTKARQDQLDEIVTEIITGEPSGGFFASKFMKDGIEREPAARMYLEEKLGLVIEEVAFVRHDYLRVGVSPDGLAIGEPTNVEIKCPKDRTHLRYWMSDSCPAEYVPQVQSQMWLTDATKCLFCSYHPGFPEDMQLRIITVPRDEEYIKKIDVEVGKFLAEVNIKVKQIKELRELRKGIKE
jgi:putative phage-type endonuclease